MKTSDFDYILPPEMIAQTPAEPRDHSRLMVLNCADSSIEHRHFYDVENYLKSGDVLVFNDSRVIAARILGRKATGGHAEILLLRRLAAGEWEALVQGKHLGPGSQIIVAGETENHSVEILEDCGDGVKKVRLSNEGALLKIGKIPLPPYIRTPVADPERYQTVYNREPGSAAAPTAGLHFTPALLERLRKKGVETRFVTLHIGLDTFRPVKEDDPTQHIIHTEYAVLTAEVAAALNAAKREGRRIISVGTTSVRVLEHAASLSDGELKPFAGKANIFILPGFKFKVVDAMITNFHLPKSTLIMMVSAFAGKENILKAYEEAKKCGYRFYSFGDAMLIVRS